MRPEQDVQPLIAALAVAKKRSRIAKPRRDGLRCGRELQGGAPRVERQHFGRVVGRRKVAERQELETAARRGRRDLTTWQAVDPQRQHDVLLARAVAAQKAQRRRAL